MTTFLCPGQGAQTPNFLHRLPEVKQVQETLQEASDTLGFDALSLDTEQSLRSTVSVQLSILIAGTAAARALEAMDVKPNAVAGISIGSFTAAVVAEAIGFKDALTLVSLRAKLMEEAYPEGYGMAAFGGLRQLQLAQLAQDAERSDERLFLANFNGPTEIVVTGAVAALDRLVALATDAGARRAQRLAVSVPSHCELLEPVAGALTKAVSDCQIVAPKLTYVGNRTARVLRTAQDVASELATNVSHPVKWWDSTTLLYELGEQEFVELPPGNVLTGLIENAGGDVIAKSFADPPLSSLVYLFKNN
ncbi:malonate decarboxylase subunit epsilon [Rhizobium sp.]|jgi:malonate decarboxylase epsilon subunit|uniref:ACP S-malonyltransferase n=1 Tax=Rhizobium sp. TaxID=391 RepID=UPI000E822C90|nr:malonate decarboxylase subunit epsilon [Rhizobium sp.]